MQSYASLLKKILLLTFLFSFSITLTSCFEKKVEEEITSPSTGGGGSASDPYANVSLSYTDIVSAYTVGEPIVSGTPTSSISDMSLLSNYTVSPALPNGITIDSTTGVISGSTTGMWEPASYTVTARTPSNNPITTTLYFGVFNSGETEIDPNSTEPRNFTYAVVDAVYYVGVPITANTPSHIGDSFSHYTYSGTYSPPQLETYGLSFDMMSGVISGTPTTPLSRTQFYVIGNFPGGSIVANIYVTIIDGPPTNLSYSNENATYPVGYSITNNSPSNTGGNIVSYSISPSLPTGLTLNTSTGIISGYPTSVTNATSYTITASNGAGSTNKIISISTPNSAPGNLTYSNHNARYTVSATISTNSPSIGAGGAATGYAITPSLPAGLSFSTSNGQITGTPTTPTAAASYTIIASNAVGSTSQTITLTVVPPGSHTIYSADGNQITAYSVDATTGEPIHVGITLSIPIVSKLLFHPTMDCAFGYSGGSLYALSVNKSNAGTLSVINSAGGLGGPLNFAMTSAGDFIYVVNNANPSTQYVARYAVNPSTCAITALGTTSVWVSNVVFVRDIAIAGNNVYVYNTAATIKNFSITPMTGDLTQIQSINMSPHSNPPSIEPAVGSGLHLRANPNGQYIYANDNLKAIESFSVNATTGMLTSLGTMVNTGTIYLNPISVDNVNSYMLSCYTSAFSAGIATVKMYSNGATGTVATIEGGAITTGYSAPQSVDVFTSDSGTYVYTTYSYSGNSGAIRLKMNTGSGGLNPVGAGLWGILSGY